MAQIDTSTIAHCGCSLAVLNCLAEVIGGVNVGEWWEFMVVVADPLRLPGGTGSLFNPIADFCRGTTR